MELQSRYYQDKGKWVDFIFKTENYNDVFTTEELIYGKMRLILLLFWRDIANKLSKTSIFKLQLKLNLSNSIIKYNTKKSFFSNRTRKYWFPNNKINRVSNNL